MTPNTFLAEFKMAGEPERYKVGETTFDPKYDGLNKLVRPPRPLDTSSEETRSQQARVLATRGKTIWWDGKGL